MPHTTRLTRAPPRFGRQRRHTEDKNRASVAATEDSCARSPLPSVARPSDKTEVRAATPPRSMGNIGTSPHVKLQAGKDEGAAVVIQEFSSCGEHFLKIQVGTVGIRRASHSEPLGRSASRSGGVPPLLCRQPRRGGCCGGLSEKTNSPRIARVRHNPSLKRSANGRPPGPRSRYGVHFLHRGPGVLPLSPA